MQPKITVNSYLPLILRGTESLVVVSGEGEVGTVEPYTGARTLRALRSRARRESANGDRWVRIATATDPTVALLSVTRTRVLS